MKRTVVVVGTQWGDEGKGKIAEYLSLQADMVVRYQGGNNAGHTIVFNNETFKLSLIPAGIFRAGEVVLGNGMVIDPKALIAEMNALQARNISCSRLKISDRAHVIFPYHIQLDTLEEELKDVLKVGTTVRGIGPAYVDKYSRTGIRIGEFINDCILKDKLAYHVLEKNKIFAAYQKPLFDINKIYAEYLQYAKILKPYVTDTSVEIDKAISQGKKVLFEGAQGVMLDIDHGTYPFVTSSNPCAGAVTIGAGIGPTLIGEIIGVVKAYSTRVGSGPFPTELVDAVGDYIRDTGKEYGTVTKRPRRIGWFDGVIVSHARRVSGLTGLSINLLDVLSKIPLLKLCVEYILDGKSITYVPSTISEFQRCIPRYIEMPGWKEDITNAKSFAELPANAQNYVKKIEEITGVPVVLISVGPDREQTIMLRDIYK